MRTIGTKRKILIFALLTISALLTSCNKTFPWTEYDVVWYSGDPEMVIIHAEEYNLKGYFIKNDTKIVFDMAWGFDDSFDIFKMDGEGDEMKVEIFLSGKFTNENDTVTLVIEEDKLFDGKYKTIVLQKKPYVKGEYEIS